MYFTSDYGNYSFPTIGQIDGSSTYFVIDVQNLIIFNYSMLIVIFTIFKAIPFLINRKITEDDYCSKFGRSFQKYFKEKSHFFNLIIGLLEVNIIIIVFYSVQKIQRPWFFAFSDKVNFVLSLIFFLAAILYSFCFYILSF